MIETKAEVMKNKCKEEEKYKIGKQDYRVKIEMHFIMTTDKLLNLKKKILIKILMCETLS